ncbi:hypothetical protein [Photorhabdus stackebrandtii]|uniref:Uncharacterized protein n=1 Tax=Photorhabdus stackebrandtii TaxID=1123042 RepID=A0A7X5QQE8_9GAMM|nr:hypothetical protein [Photorhabdus stackebrandtii]NHB98574.1 hypothetical protein [Photorhabdus stackebrandtii]
MNVDGVVKYLGELRKFKASRIFLDKKNFEISSNSSDNNILKLVSISKDIPPIVEPKAFELDKQLSNLSSSILEISDAINKDIILMEKIINESEVNKKDLEASLSSLTTSLKYKNQVLDNYMKDGARIASKSQDLNKALEGYAGDISKIYQEIKAKSNAKHRDKINEIASLVIKRNNAGLSLLSKILDDPKSLNENIFSITDIIDHQTLGSKRLAEENDALSVSETVIIGVITIIVTIVVAAFFYGLNEFTNYKNYVEEIAHKEKALLHDNSDLLIAYKISGSINDLFKASQAVHDDYLGVINRLSSDNVAVLLLVDRINKILKRGDKINNEVKESVKQSKKTEEENRAVLQMLGQIVKSQQKKQ